MFPAEFDVRWALAVALALLVVAFIAWRAWRPKALPPKVGGQEIAEDAIEVPARLDEASAEAARVGASPAVVRGLPTPTRHPIVLAHGYFGFDIIQIPRFKREYFRGIKDTLTKQGYDVHTVRLAPVSSIAFRAAQLKRQIDSLEAPRVNIIAHSMGGLDARYAITKLGLAPRVASLTTIGTPHHGTPLADRSRALFGDWRRIRKIMNSVGIDVDGLYDLTTRSMEAFNRDIPDSPEVAYACVIGAVSTETPVVNAFLAAGHAYLDRVAGPNDGIVPASSQRWGTVLGEVFADHWAQVGWSAGFDVRAFYTKLVAQLADLGY